MYIKAFEDCQIKCINSIQIHGVIGILSFSYQSGRKIFQKYRIYSFQT